MSANKFILLTFFVLAFFLAVTTAAECGEFKVTSIDTPFTYVNVQHTVAITGCFPEPAPAVYKVTIGPLDCKIATVSETTITCRTSLGLKKTELNTNVVIFSQKAQAHATLEGAFSYYSPIFQYVTPYSIPLIDPKTPTEFRLAVEDIPTQGNVFVSLLAHDVAYNMELISRTNNFLTLRLPETFPFKIDDAGYYDIVVKDATLDATILFAPMSIFFYHPTYNQDRYITQTSPQWVSFGTAAVEKRVITVTGNGFEKVAAFRLYHPYSKEQVTFPVLDGATAAQVQFDITAFNWLDAEVFPAYNQTLYHDVLMYRGPIQYDLISTDGLFVVSSEILVIPEAKPLDIAPGNQIPQSFAFKTDQDNELNVVLSQAIENYPNDVPTFIHFNSGSDITWTIKRDDLSVNPAVGTFAVVQDKIVFPLPECPKCDAKKEYKGELCLSTHVDSKCILSLGQFTYLASPANQQPHFIKVNPSSAYFESLETAIDIAFFGIKADDQDVTSRFVYKHSKSEKLFEPEWERIDRHIMRAHLPRKCHVPGVCPEGKYEPVLYKDAERKEVITTSNSDDAQLNLSFNRDDAYRVGLVLKQAFDKETMNATLAKVVDGIKALYPDTETILPGTVVAHQKDKFFSLQLDDDKEQVLVTFTIRPNSTVATLPAVKIADFIKADATTEGSELSHQIPTLASSGHKFILVHYCNSTLDYDEGPCEDEKDKSFPRWVIYAALGAGALVFILLIGFCLKTQTNLLGKKTKDDELLLNGGDYDQIH